MCGTLEQALASVNVQVAGLKGNITEHVSFNMHVLLHCCLCGMPSSNDVIYALSCGLSSLYGPLHAGHPLCT